MVARVLLYLNHAATLRFSWSGSNFVNVKQFTNILEHLTYGKCHVLCGAWWKHECIYIEIRRESPFQSHIFCRCRWRWWLYSDIGMFCLWPGTVCRMGVVAIVSRIRRKLFLIHVPISVLVYVIYPNDWWPLIARTLFRMPQQHVFGRHLGVIFY